MAKTILVLCASALLVQTISGQSYGNTVYADKIDIDNYGITGSGIGLATGGEGFGNSVSLGSGYGVGSGYSSGLYGSGIYGSNARVTGCGLGYGAGYNGAAFGAINNRFVATGSGGDFPVSTSSSIAPSGLSVVSDNRIEGPVAVVGTLPFLAAVALEGQVPSAGSAGVEYSCGNGNVGIMSESAGAGVGVASAGFGGYGLSNAGFGYGAGLGYDAGLGYSTGLSTGCGCGSVLY